MKRGFCGSLSGSALAAGSAASLSLMSTVAFAGAFTVTGHGPPVSLGFGDVTTSWDSYFTGPITLTTTSSTGNTTIASDFGPSPYATALVPDSAGWSQSGSASQELVVAAPELSRWAMLLAGFAALAYAGYRGSRKRQAYAE